MFAADYEGGAGNAVNMKELLHSKAGGGGGAVVAGACVGMNGMRAQ